MAHTEILNLVLGDLLDIHEACREHALRIERGEFASKSLGTAKDVAELHDEFSATLNKFVLAGETDLETSIQLIMVIDD